MLFIILKGYQFIKLNSSSLLKPRDGIQIYTYVMSFEANGIQTDYTVGLSVPVEMLIVVTFYRRQR
jgi:hypothetical protein